MPVTFNPCISYTNRAQNKKPNLAFQGKPILKMEVPPPDWNDVDMLGIIRRFCDKAAMHDVEIDAQSVVDRYIAHPNFRKNLAGIMQRYNIPIPKIAS